MTGGSLGLRTGSYGTLPAQHSNNNNNNNNNINSNNNNSINNINGSCGTALGIREGGSAGKRNSKMYVTGKERRSSWICKVAGRRKVGMLMLLVVGVAVLSSFYSAVNKDEEQPAVPESDLAYSDHVWKFVNPGKITSSDLEPPPTTVTTTDEKENATLVYYASRENESQFLDPALYQTKIPSHHPCEHFPRPPPPLDRKRIGPRPCPVCYVPVDQAIAYMPALPSVSPVLKNLAYVSEENLLANESSGGSLFGGYPSLQQRDESYDIKESMTVHCGFVRGKKPGQGTGFDIDETDLLEMEKCRGVVVASAIFGNYDIMQQPRNISEASRRTACFYMFMDEETEAFIRNSSIIDNSKRVGLWRVVVVRNLPYADARRNGKVPKLLLHRLFPNARFSLWIDGKLELVVDPYQLLERFLWRNNDTFAISKHYRRFDVFDEAEANKAAGKYENASIDYQIEFYKREGLTRYSDAKLPIVSDVPEGCVIIREHTPLTNLFTCLWFNEVDRFTSRDQLSFSTVRDRIMSGVNWTISMFMDCERRNFVVQTYHRDLLEQRNSLATLSYPPPPILTKGLPVKSASSAATDGAGTRSQPSKKLPARRGKDRKSSSRRHRAKSAAVGRDPNLF